jgi:hypothetical protein
MGLDAPAELRPAYWRGLNGLANLYRTTMRGPPQSGDDAFAKTP